MANTYLTRTPSSNGSTTINTWSFWVKRTDLNDYETLYSSEVSSSNVFKIGFTLNALEILFYVAPSYVFQIKTNRLFRDVSAFYNIVIIQNAGASTNTDRLQIWVNGVRETSFAITNFPDLNEGAAPINASGVLQNIGTTGTEYFGGSMSHIHLCDGTAYDASAFGETDATTGEWKIKTSPSVTYGNNGFFILKDGNSVTDQSGNSNNFTVGGGTLTKTEDCPSNVFATLNPLATASYATLTNGNLTVTGNTGANEGATFSSLVMPNATSKMYWEIKCVATTAGSDGASNPKYGFIQAVRGFTLANGNAGNGGRTNPSYDVMIRPNGNVDDDDGTSSISVSTWSAGDILSFALDNVNGAFYVGKNGTWQNSGNPASGSSRTGAIKTWSPTQGGNTGVLDGQAVCISSYNGSISNINFGNGYFGTTAVSSAGTNASGIGIFEYDVPTGFTALSTKGLNL